MRVISSAEGSRRVWYRPEEIEQRCTAALAAADALPVAPDVQVDIERFVERGLDVEVDYGADLPATILGFAEFGQPRRMAVRKDLTDAATGPQATIAQIGRWRATLAHEAAHFLLHAELFAPAPARPGRPATRPIRCPRESFDETRPPPDWREVQANMGMAALLMPTELFDAAATTTLMQHGLPVPPVPPSAPWLDAAILVLAERFGVSRQAARIRLRTLGYTG